MKLARSITSISIEFFYYFPFIIEKKDEKSEEGSI